MKHYIALGLGLSVLFLPLTGCMGGKDSDDTGNAVTDIDGDGFSIDEGDCDDENAEVHPEAVELCDSVDNNCDGDVDEEGAEDAATWYRDADGDGFGNGENTRVLCEQPSGYLADGSDCDDLDAEVSPEGVESCNGLDDDCDGEIDGENALGVTPWYADTDGDGFGDAAVSQMNCEATSGYVADSTDCDDTNAAVHPEAVEICSGLDDNCDGSADGADAVGATPWYSDSDSDGYGDEASAQVACLAPSGMIADGTDCDDSDVLVFPGADEYCNGSDDDCDGSVDEDDALDTLTWYADSDGDSYGDTAVSSYACNASFGWVSDDTDCDDTNDGVNPGAWDWCDDGVDNDCDGSDETLNPQRMQQEVDTDGDGVVDFFAYYTLDADGNSVSADVDSDGNGTVDYVYYWAYDADGNRTSTDIDMNGDGVGDYDYTYVYDSDGNLTSYTFYYYGILIEAYTYVYDSDGNMTDRFVDTDGDGVDDHISAWTYDADGNLLSQEIDSDGDGTVDERTTWGYDVDGNEVEEHQDSDGDGAIDLSQWRNYDSDGNISYEAYDNDGDSIVDITYTYSRDSDGNALSADNDTDGDGTIDRQWIWTYDTDGNNTSIDVDTDMDGITDVVYYEATFDVDGNRTWYAYDSDLDGAWDETYTYTYDSDGNVLSAAEDTDGDGNAEVTYTYNSNGDTTSKANDSDSDGVVDDTYWYLFACDDSI
ncbi:MAG: MopE-related protein [Myxococcota bacterium]|nr:MopE-related protein [Myxococcota bacterium]